MQPVGRAFPNWRARVIPAMAISGFLAFVSKNPICFSDGSVSCSILPISRIVIEVAQFDTQKINNPEISGKEYQEGNQLGFWNVREYVLARDGHKCQYCKGKSKSKILNVHHIESRKTGGDSPSNLITLCETCHKEYHKGNMDLKSYV